MHWPAGVKAQGRAAQPVSSRHRRRQDDSGSRRPARTDFRQRHRAGAVRRRQHGVDLRRRQSAGDAYGSIFRDDGQSRHLSRRLDCGHQTSHALEGGPPPPLDSDIWELYGPDDWTQAKNLAAENPKKLAELQRLWLIEASNTMSCRSTIAASSGSIPTSPGARSSFAATATIAVRRHAGERSLRADAEEQIALRHRAN